MKEPVRESFVFHAEYVDDLPDEFRASFAMMAVNYGIYGEEPDLSGLELALWVKIKRRIDRDCQEWESTRGARSRAGSSHRGNQYSAGKTEQDGTNRNKLEQDGTNGTVSVFVPVSVNVNDDDDDSVRERTSPPPPPDSILTDTECDPLAAELFAKFRDAGLPCQKGDARAFYELEYKKALSRMGDISPDDVLETVGNYIRELENPDSYVNKRYSLDEFVRTKTFANCRPENYSPENFVRWDAEPKEKPERTGVHKKILREHPSTCGCGEPLFDSSGGQGLSWYCKRCEREWILRKGKWEEDA